MATILEDTDAEVQVLALQSQLRGNHPTDRSEFIDSRITVAIAMASRHQCILGRYEPTITTNLSVEINLSVRRK
jgi:hypothetical protein